MRLEPSGQRPTVDDVFHRGGSLDAYRPVDLSGVHRCAVDQAFGTMADDLWCFGAVEMVEALVSDDRLGGGTGERRCARSGRQGALEVLADRVDRAGCQTGESGERDGSAEARLGLTTAVVCVY